MTALKKVPKFKTEDDERDFWSTHDATDYLDFSQAEETVFPNLTPEVPRRDRNQKGDQKDHWGDKEKIQIFSSWAARA